MIHVEVSVRRPGMPSSHEKHDLPLLGGIEGGLTALAHRRLEAIPGPATLKVKRVQIETRTVTVEARVPSMAFIQV